MTVLRSIFAPGLALALSTPVQAAEVGEDGLHIQPFFADTFLELSEDLAEAAAEGKDLMVIIEQRGCPYCRELHEVNFAREEISSYADENFLVLQLNMWGAREMTDFDGESMEERDLIRKWFVSFTPTTLFFTLKDPENPPEDMREALAFLMPGYFKPFHHMSAMEYVASDGYAEEPNFQRWLQAKADKMREEGHEVVIWE